MQALAHSFVNAFTYPPLISAPDYPLLLVLQMEWLRKLEASFLTSSPTS